MAIPQGMVLYRPVDCHLSGYATYELFCHAEYLLLYTCASLEFTVGFSHIVYQRKEV